MGDCHSKNQKEQLEKHDDSNKNEANKLTISKSDFIQRNQGRFSDFYQLGQIIGTGTYGEVRKCMTKIEKDVRAVKILVKNNMSKEEHKDFAYEIAILKKLDHPNILKLYEVFEDQQKYQLVTEYCYGGELFDEIIKIGSFSEQKAANIIEQVLQAVSYFHQIGVVHRDLKPENILIDKEQNNILKVIDFGTAIVYDKKSELLNGVKGTSYYIAPEVLQSQYDERCDVWSIGVMLYILLSGYPPFDGEYDHQIIKNVKTQPLKMDQEIWNQISEDAKSLIRRMLEKDYKKRIFAKDALQNPWFKNSSQKRVPNDIMEQTLQHLSTFNAEQKLQQATLTMMVQNMITKKEQAQLQQIFQQLDTNRDGKLQYNELLQGYKEFHGETKAKYEVDRIFKLIDQDHSGEIDFSEFITATINRSRMLTEERLQQAFKMYDKDQSGTISVDEIKKIIGVGKNVQNDVWDAIMKQISLNQNGEITFTEFQKMMLQISH